METPAGSSEDFAGPSFGNLRQLSSQLDQWRSMLPVQLQWPDEDPAMFPPGMQYIRYYAQPLDPAFASTGHVPPGTPLFSTDLDTEPVLYA
jgi:hypothetical protein